MMVESSTLSNNQLLYLTALKLVLLNYRRRIGEESSFEIRVRPSPGNQLRAIHGADAFGVSCNDCINGICRQQVFFDQ
jgi:hypothetical protein